MKHLIDIERLQTDEIYDIFKQAENFLKYNKDHTQVSYTQNTLLQNKTIYNLFYEPSTRTRVSFELAARNLGANVINLDVASSSVKKGESLKDTILTLKALQADAIIVRHSENDTADFIREVCNDKPSVINAGNGVTSHPTQALLDVFTILQNKPDITKIQVSIIGDILHSRVAKSLIAILRKLGCNKINIIAPDDLLPEETDEYYNNITVCSDLKSGLKNTDVICCLRLQKERMKHSLILDEQKFFETYGITENTIKFAKPDAIVMHPGPIIRNVEISSEVADSEQSVILNQVTNGVAIRMAVLAKCLMEN